MKSHISKRFSLSVAFITAAFALSACGGMSDADKASDNLSKAAEQFEVQRSIIGINAITDTPAFEVEGKCSIDLSGSVLVVTCKHAEDDIRKHYLGTADNVYWVSTQLEAMDVSQFRTRVIIKPESIIPDFDLVTSGDKNEE